MQKLTSVTGMVCLLFTFNGLVAQTPALQDVMTSGNTSNKQLKLSTTSTPNPNTSGGDLTYGSVGFFNDNFGIENVRIEGYYPHNYFVDRGSLKFYTRGADGLAPRMVIDHVGSIGIGRAVPQYTLDVYGTARFGEYAFIGSGINQGFYEDATNGAYRSKNNGENGFYFQNEAGANTRMFVGLNGSYAGRVGIGTVFPESALDVVGDAKLSGDFRLANSKGIGWNTPGKYGAIVNTDANLLFYTGTAAYNERLRIEANGNVAIGTATNSKNYKLAVEGTIGARRLKVTQESWADYVFDSAYRLPSLREVEHFIQQNKHLPEVPSAAVVKEEGLDVGNNQALLLKKIEELTLYIIEQNKKMEKLEQQVATLQQKLP